jgi:hypothetical protein
VARLIAEVLEGPPPPAPTAPPPLAPARSAAQEELFPDAAGDDPSQDSDDHPGPESASARGPP